MPLTPLEQLDIGSIIDKLQKAKNLNDVAKEYGYDDPEALINSILEQIAVDKGGQSYLDLLKRRMERGEKVERLLPALKTLYSLSQLGLSLDQIRRSNKELGSIPTTPTPDLSVDTTQLDNAIRQARRGTFDTAALLAPYERALREQNLINERQARLVGGGQQGLTAALLQANANRSVRNNNMPQAIAELRRQELANLNNLIAARTGLQQQALAQRASLYPTQLQNEWRQRALAASLGSLGRSNLMTALGNLSQNLAALDWDKIGGLFNRRNKRVTGDPIVDWFSQEADASLRTSLSPYLNQNTRLT